MLLAAKAWQMRQASRQSFHAGDLDRAFDLAARAQQLHPTAGGRFLRLLSAWLMQGFATPPP